MPRPQWLTGAVGRAEALLARISNRSTVSGERRSLLTVIAAVALAAASIFMASQIELASRIDVTWLVTAGLLGALQVPLNAMEFTVIAQIAGVAMGRRDAYRVVAVGSALNLLPIPGGALARIEALRRKGSKVRESGQAMVLTTSIWLAMASILAGILALVSGRELLALGIFVVGAAGGLGIWLTRRALTPSQAVLRKVVLIEIAFIALATVRFWAMLKAISFDATFAQAAVIASSSAIATTVRIVPGAIGIWEGLAAGLGIAMGIDGRAVFIAATLIRVWSLTTNGMAAAIAALPFRGQPTSGDS